MEPAAQIGPYRVRRLLGKGAMGEVYLAHDPELGRDVALKVLERGFADDEGHLGRLRREARALASLSHANIATVHGFEEHDGAGVIVMEAIEGETLAGRLRGKPIPTSEALELALQLARALEAAHEKGIVHRDLKPGNVMVTPRGELKVLDFGLAKPLQRYTGEAESMMPTATIEATQAGSVMGTAPYMSPEQARGQQVDARTDIWAFACVIYEMLAGKRAFDRETFADTLAAVIEVEPDWSLLPDDVPDGLRRSLQRMLAKEPERRLQHVGDARIELEEVTLARRAQEIAARDSGGEERSAPGVAGSKGTASPRVGRVATGVAAVGLLAIAIATGWWLSGGGPGEVTERSIAVLPFETLGQDDATAFTDGIHGDILTRLSKISGLRVTSRTSVMRFRGPTASLPEIARELGVNWVLMGEVQEAGGQVQVNARLVRAREDRQVWAESYRRALTADNLFRIQSELTEEIAGQLQARLTPAERRAVESAPTGNLAAYRTYVRGRRFLDQRTEGGMRQAADLFRQTIAQDPGYALAWVGLADALVLLEDYGHVLPAGSLLPEGRAAIDRALELEPGLAEAHASLGLFHSHVRNGPESIRELERAIALQPSYAEAHNWLSWVHGLLGNPSLALESARQAVELDPLAPEAISNLVNSLLQNGQPEQAMVEVRRLEELQPNFPGELYEAIALFELGRSEETASLLRGASVPWAGSGPVSSLAVVQATNGNLAEAREILQQLEQSDDHFGVGLVRAALGDVDGAFAAFRETEDWDAWSTLALRYFFRGVLDPVRQDPRFAEVLEAVDRSWGVSGNGA